MHRVHSALAKVGCPDDGGLPTLHSEILRGECLSDNLAGRRRRTVGFLSRFGLALGAGLLGSLDRPQRGKFSRIHNHLRHVGSRDLSQTLLDVVGRIVGLAVVVLELRKQIAELKILVVDVELLGIKLLRAPGRHGFFKPLAALCRAGLVGFEHANAATNGNADGSNEHDR